MNKKTYLECVNTKSKKFYEIEVIENNVFIQAGRINCHGKSFKKSFDTPAGAEKFYLKQVNKKLKKGYKKTQKKIVGEKQLSFPFLKEIKNI